LAGLVKLCKEFNDRENIEDLRVDMELGQEANAGILVDMRQRDVEEKAVINEVITKNKGEFDEFLEHVNGKFS